MGVAGRGVSTPDIYKHEAQSYKTELSFSKITSNVDGYTISHHALKIVFKGSHATKSKIPFSGFLVQIAKFDIKRLSPFHIQEQFYTTFPIRFRNVDIIYPFHSFW